MCRKFWPSLLIIFSLGFSGLSHAAGVPESFASLAAKVKPCVVNISTTKVVKGGRFHQGGDSSRGEADPFRDFFGDDFFRRFFGDQQPREFKSQSLGSGFIIDREGLILTNNHVVESADEVLVKLSDEHEFKAKVVGTDPKTDIALIQVEAKGVELQPAELGDSDKVQVGDWVLAVGNPFGYAQTVTAGIIGAKERVIGSGPYDSFLQTDAAINPGNSGGPLFDMQGRVVGINTAIVSGGTGIGFAIPVNMAKDMLPQLKKGKVTRGWLGVAIQEMTPELGKSFGLESPSGALVSEVVKDGPAQKAGLRRGDVIVDFDGAPIHKVHELPMAVAKRAPDTEVDVTVLREGAKKTLRVKLGEMPEEGQPEAVIGDDLGLTVQEVTPELRKHLDLEVDQGLVVSGVDPAGAAAAAGLRRGDVIVEINQQPVTDVKSYREALSASKGKESVLFLVRRGSGTVFLVVPQTKK